MGLAASQARLLTLTSRLSSIELKQQAIANSKILLSSDSDKVSEKYTKALNNQTLKIADGLNEKALTYAGLKELGYGVRRASDGVVAKSGVYSGKEVTKPTCKRPEEIEKPTQTSNYASLPSHVSTQYFGDVTHEMSNDEDYIRTAFNLVSNTYVKSDGTVSNSTKGGYDYAKTTEKRNELWVEMGKPMLDNLAAKLQSSNPTLAQKISSINNSITTKLNNLANPEGTTNEGRNAMFIYKDTTAAITSASNALFDEGYYDQLASTSLASDDYNQNGQKVPTNHVSTDEYKKAVENWESEVADAKAQWDAYDNYVAEQASAGNATSEQQNLYSQLVSSPDFLSQGLLSGYLLLTKDGKDVSLSSATNIIEQYDKSDDAAAEAEYNAEMAKINRKEKILDNQLKSLDTEHSAMQQEITSVKSLISDRAQKDFTLFG